MLQAYRGGIIKTFLRFFLDVRKSVVNFLKKLIHHCMLLLFKKKKISRIYVKSKMLTRKMHVNKPYTLEDLINAP